MGRMDTKGRYITAERAVDEKLQVLKDFYIVDRKNEEEYRKVLLQAVRNEPNTQFDIVIDRVARRMIAERLGG